MRIACASGKGGSGKSSLSALLALSLTAAGKAVTVSDHDPQLAFLDWLEDLAKKGLLPFRKLSPTSGVAGEGDPQHEIGDFAPEEPHALAAKMRGWDLVLIPTRPSPLDVKAASAFVGALPDPARARVVWNALDTSNLSTPQALQSMLAPHPQLRPLRAGLKNRAAYRYARIQGVAALTKDAREEFLALGMEVFA